MLLVDDLLIGGLRFVLDKLAQAVDTELNDETRLREELLAAQMRRELGEITEDDFAELEAALLDRLREVREAQKAAAGPAARPGEMKVTGIEATFTGDEHAEEE